jgi:hypothetical protein
MKDSIKLVGGQIYENASELFAGVDVIRNGWTADPMQGSGNVSKLMETVYETQMRRVANLYQRAESSPNVKYAITQFVTENSDFTNPSPNQTYYDDYLLAKEVRHNLDTIKRGGLPPKRLAEYVHDVTDFTQLTASCASRAFQRLSQEMMTDTSCLDSIVLDTGDRDFCDSPTGKIAIVPQSSDGSAGPNTPCGDNCNVKKWRFTEMTRGSYKIAMYSDSVSWNWWLLECVKYGGFTDEVLSWLVNIQKERRAISTASLLANDSLYGSYTSYGQTFSNVITAADGTCNPNPVCHADVLNILNAWDLFRMQQRDMDGSIVKPRDYKLVTGSPRLYKLFQSALDNPRITEVAPSIDSCSTTVETSRTVSLPKIDVCYVPEFMDVLPTNQLDTTWWLVPTASRLSKNAFEKSALRNYRNPRLARRKGDWANMTGGNADDLGNGYCRTFEVMALHGFGAGAVYSELAFRSNGTGVC